MVEAAGSCWRPLGAAGGLFVSLLSELFKLCVGACGYAVKNMEYFCMFLMPSV